MTANPKERIIKKIDNFDEYIDDFENTNEQSLLLKKRKGITEKKENGDSNTIIEIGIENKMKPKRVYWVDWLRVFASILVVYIHVSYMNIDRGRVKETKWNKIFIHNSLPRHCVPIFVTISGIFFFKS